MSIPKAKWDELFKKLPEKDKTQILDYAEYLYDKRKKEFYEALKTVEEDDEELNDEEIEALRRAEEAEETRPLEDVARELGLLWK